MGRATRAALLAGLCLVLPTPGGASPRTIDYLYVDASEGSSSGGHVGVRVGEDVFHFEHRAPGILVLRRETFDEFRRYYTRIENRSIEVTRIPVSEEAHRRLRDRLGRLHLVQRERLGVLDTLRMESRILEEMRRGALGIDGAGLFVAGDGDDGGASDPALLALRQRVVDAYGPEFLAKRMDALRRRLGTLDPDPEGSGTIEMAGEEIPPPTYPVAHRYRDTLTALTALEVLAAARLLAPDAVIATASEELRLRGPEAAIVTAMSDALGRSLVRLLDSRRPDWGFPLLVGMARLAALERTRASGRWVFLDGFAPDSERIERTRVAERPALVAVMLGDARAALGQARERLVARVQPGGAFAEQAFAEVESAGNRFAETWRARHEGHGLRVTASALLPRRRGSRPAVLAPPPATLAARLASAAERERAHVRDLRRLHRYDLVTRNCVSELLHELDRALSVPPVESRSAIDLVPALSTLAVRERYGPSTVAWIPSRRLTDLARLYETENGLRIFLRESNTITSTLYRRNPRDSVFLFFTDDVVVARPLFGAVNLIAGVGASVVGLATLPFDGGVMLRSGARGVVFSLPELFFQNIRKGSFEYAGGGAEAVEDP